ncbi:type I secretion system LssZ [Legionella beliardensis]|uniref:Type I secretion system LssZ n=1 Tax=Legionella beliardensis TaxID=91822 RepID=A0A378I271_9GAMM|nr:type I secretion system protein LssZ [Legionella beliardensis]STX29093.1 type I secretion system LssZ [Legionella beliardensis]
MNYVRDLIHMILPLVSLALLIIGIKNKYKNYIILALWINIFALIINYQLAGGEILGYYFNYFQALIYSINLLVLLACISYLVLSFSSEITPIRYLNSFLAAVSSIGVVLLLINLWVNAWFIENRMPGTPVLQVAAFKPLDYCAYRYVFYKVNNDGTLKFMCPNHYGLVPSVGTLTKAPDFLLKQLPTNLKNKFQHTQIKHKPKVLA